MLRLSGNLGLKRPSNKLSHLVARRSMTFTGNSAGVDGTDEERMTRVFGGRLKGAPPTSTSRVLARGNLMIAGVDVPAKPLQPDNCCMSGCVNCVWEIYNDDIRYWKNKRVEAVQKIESTNDIWPENWDPPIQNLKLKNLPKTLHAKKLQLEESLANTKKVDVKSLFPPRKYSLPSSVVEAKKRNLIRKAKEVARKEANENDGWDDIPVFIKAFAEFERKKKLMKNQKS